jgi:hypothetical protein
VVDLKLWAPCANNSSILSSTPLRRRGDRGRPQAALFPSKNKIGGNTKCSFLPISRLLQWRPS